MKYILITGVSTGIGYDAVRHFVGRDFFVFGSVRKEADQQRLESEFPCLLYTSPSPRDGLLSRMPSSA